MTLKQLEDEMDMLVEDDSLKSFFRDWINATILAIAADFELPALKLLSPEALTVDNTSWIWELPTNFHKKLFRCNFVDGNSQVQRVTVFDRRDDIELKDHTIVGPQVTSVATATQGGKNYLLIDPLPAAAVTLNLWYYRKPAVLEDPGDIPDLMPEEFHDRVIMPKVIARNYQALLDQVVSSDLKGITYWEGEYLKGVKGAPGTPGLINYLTKTERPPRRTGGTNPVGHRGGR